MNLFALSPSQLDAGQIVLAALLAIAGFKLLLPRPRGRWISGGIAILVAAMRCSERGSIPRSATRCRT